MLLEWVGLSIGVGVGRWCWCWCYGREAGREGGRPQCTVAVCARDQRVSPKYQGGPEDAGPVGRMGGLGGWVLGAECLAGGGAGVGGGAVWCVARPVRLRHGLGAVCVHVHGVCALRCDVVPRE